MSAVDEALPVRPQGAFRLRTMLDAWRGITRRQLWTTFLLGFAFNLVVVAGNLTMRRPFLFGAGIPGFLVALGAQEIKAFAVLLAVVVADRVAGGDPRRRSPYAIAIGAGALAGAMLAAAWFQAGLRLVLGRSPPLRFDVQDLLYIALEIVLYAAAAVTVMLDRREAARARRRMHVAELERIAAQRRSIESDLQALQARVEPQFLFRTLAQTGRLYARNPAHGERMLDELIAYLRAAMPRMRDTASTLGQELELARAYLAIASVVDDGRLAYEIDAPAGAEAIRMPPMMLLPLLDRLVSGRGEDGPRIIRVRVARDGGSARLEIDATGAGPDATAGDGAIAGLQDRLQALYGHEASLRVKGAPGQASVAILSIPVETQDPVVDVASRADRPAAALPGRPSDITMVARGGTASLPVAVTGHAARWFAGLGWKPVGFMLVACVLDALRRTVQTPLDQFVLGEWLLGTLKAALWCVIVGLPVMLALAATYNLAPRRPGVRFPALALAVAFASALGLAAAVAVDAHFWCSGPIGSCSSETGMVAAFVARYVRYVSLCGLFAVVFVYLRIAEESRLRSQEAEVERARFVQRMEEARLRMLQAQIEPHFLFNTLANVRRLYQTASGEGAAMLDHLMRYLEVVLPQMRATDSTLDREAELTRSYLEIQRLRMGHRLTFDFDIPDSLRQAAMPPMMLVTLAENAIKHGVAPLPEGGHVGISARVQDEQVRVRVVDTGQGFTQSSGGGTGLANIRARLAAMYGAAGRLSLALNTPRGVVATLTVPLASTAAAARASL